MNQNKKIGVVIVAYKNPQLTAKFVCSELAKVKSNIQVVIVNVASTFKDSEELAQQCHANFANHEGVFKSNNEENIYLIWTLENLGYANGNNLGVSFFLLNNAECDYYLFTNDDIEILHPSILEELIECADNDQSIAGIGPKVTCLDGSPGSPIYQATSIVSLISAYFKSKLKIESETSPVIDQPAKVYWISGAFMLVKANWFDKVGGFDSRTFLYYEEAILAERFAAQGGHFYYYPKVEVIHFEGGSTRATTTNKKKLEIIEKSRLLYYSEYRKEGWLSMFLYKLFYNIRNALS